jgi:transcription elongation factor Elf1
MADITFTCANCGGTELVEDKPESTRNLLCKRCGGPLLDQRSPGDTITVA